VALVKWPAGQSRQEVEPGAGWYLEMRQEVQPPASRYSPAAQPVQSARRAEPAVLVKWPAGQSRQEVEPGPGWYVETGQEVQAPAEACLPAGQTVQPEAPPQPSPVPQAGQSRQEDEAGAGWSLLTRQEVQTPTANSRLSTAMSPASLLEYPPPLVPLSLTWHSVMPAPQATAMPLAESQAMPWSPDFSHRLVQGPSAEAAVSTARLPVLDPYMWY
jgi:hypothetical protein